jgi:integrase
VQQILEMPIQGKISTTTLNKYLTRVSSLFKWALKHRYVTVNYAEGLMLPRRRKPEDDREAYAKDDIARMVSALPCDSTKPERFWIPLVGMYSGMRINEICQLHINDMVEVDGIYCFDVNAREERSVKTISGRRIVPVHPTLLKSGFREYVERQGNDNGQVWPNLVKKRDGHAQDFGKFFQRFNRANVTKNPKRVFHSLRHNMANSLKQAGIQEVVIAEILGHANDSVTTGRYGKSYRPAVLLEALQKLIYGVEDQIKNLMTP